MGRAFSKTTTGRLKVERLPIRFVGDEKWVISRSFNPGGETRVRHVLRRVRRLSDDEARAVLGDVLNRFEHRHHDMEEILEENCSKALSAVGESNRLSRSHRLLLGSYFTMEYSIASAALFNPSIVVHPDQSQVPPGGKRFIMSLRATGEGHVSSIVFRTGLIHPDHSITVDPPGAVTHRAKLSPDRVYDKQLFWRKLNDMAIKKGAVDFVMHRLPKQFTMEQLERAIDRARSDDPTLLQSEETIEGMLWLARENYQLRLPDGAAISDVVIFPQSENESMGLEDLRLVAFEEDDGTTKYYGTYTAFNGFRILPQLMESDDFRRISIHTINGACAQNKGMALFPRRVNGHYCMCSRIDGENLYIMYSDLLQFWETAEVLRTPKHPWEFMQLGNCGSPLETEAGWLLLTHGVGPMRTYCIGVMLLERDNPLNVIGHLDEPLIMPTESEREGYVPNVVYTCGAMIHQDRLYIPYAMSDTATGFAMVELDKLLDRLIG